MKKQSSEYEFVREKSSWLKKTFKEEKAPSDEPLAVFENSLLLVKNANKSYGSVKALCNVSLNVSRGKIVGLLGPTGSGKTTLTKLIAGLLTLDSGEIRVLGKQIGIETKKAVAYLSEKNSLPNRFTVKEAVMFYEDFFEDFDRARAEKMLADLSIDQNEKIKALSKGTKEKVGLVLVMARKAELYVLDEPLSGVDPAARDYIIDTIIKNTPESSSVIISTHLISDIERIMDEFIFMKYGEVYTTGTPEEIRKKYGKSVDSYFREVFRC